jgi:hypothetical protein
MDFDNKIKPKTQTQPVKKDFQYYRGQLQPHFFIAELLYEDEPEYQKTFATMGEPNPENQPVASGPQLDPNDIPNGVEMTFSEHDALQACIASGKTFKECYNSIKGDLPDPEPEEAEQIGYDFGDVFGEFDYTEEGMAEALKQLEELIKTNPKVRLWWREWVDNDFSNEDFIADPSKYKIDPSFGRQ